MAKTIVDRSHRFRLRLIVAFMIPSIISCLMLEKTSRDVSIEFPNDPRVDQSFLSEQPCKAPCWYGLELGKASVEDIETTLSSLTFINSASIRTQKISYYPEELLFFADCVYSELNEHCISLKTSSEGKLRKIILFIYYPLTIETAIEQLGKPTYYISDPISGSDACSIHIYWPNASVSAVVEASPQERYCIGENSERVNIEAQIELLIYSTIES